MLKFIKQEIVLVISFILAVVSCFLVPPSKAYIDYIDFRTLALLFCLMSVVAGLTRSGIVDKASDLMLGKCKSLMSVFIVLCVLPFFVSMIVTNDVALITFVPFGIAVMKNIKADKAIVPLVVIQTIAANMGSVLTPIGNPQNLFIQSYYHLSASEFVATMLPVWVVSFAIVIAMSIVAVKKCESSQQEINNNSKNNPVDFIYLYRSIAALIVCLLCVFDVIDYKITLMAVVVILFGNIFKKVDYALLMTFVCFFVFSGNIGSLSAVREVVTKFVQKDSFVSSLCLSQVISNVPSSVFLASFTSDWKGLLMGVDVGGLGTPVASLASLISMKFYAKSEGANMKKFMLVFMSLNIIALVVLCVLKVIAL